MSTTANLVSELATLRAAVAAHRALVVAACEVRDEAIEAVGITVTNGRYDLDPKDEWRYLSVEAATTAYNTLRDDTGYYWACSRMSDLERLLGESVPQLPIRIGNDVPLFGGDVPEAHESVASFLAAA